LAGFNTIEYDILINW